ncbi:TetR/AcrR family transcriptional regulator [Nocardia sp. alder85J]|uniref:TetR/AcrR family transcriptional regulator n=1 Tax=Nocardia sp. alder85J TaxID=2862949 RepID=UPI001CD48F9D|nr:TetR/AcrR family transcriptional regulator [Nocardia sp. alder85J]MCX4095755.1 helix-turn-helix domain containing protein [Nocardia sp. alder85J]
MSTLRERNRLRTRADIATAAIALFEEHGYDATTIEQIAKSAGVSIATYFRHFPAKEDVLFSDEDLTAAAMIELVAERADRTVSVAALADPIAAFAADLEDERIFKLTHLVMTNRQLEPRSLRIRLRWERDVARRLATEQGRTEPSPDDTLIASMAVTCLAVALRFWDKTSSSSGLSDLVRQMFARSTEVMDGRPSTGQRDTTP